MSHVALEHAMPIRAWIRGETPQERIERKILRCKAKLEGIRALQSGALPVTQVESAKREMQPRIGQPRSQQSSSQAPVPASQWTPSLGEVSGEVSGDAPGDVSSGDDTNDTTFAPYSLTSRPTTPQSPEWASVAANISLMHMSIGGATPTRPAATSGAGDEACTQTPTK